MEKESAEPIVKTMVLQGEEADKEVDGIEFDVIPHSASDCMLSSRDYSRSFYYYFIDFLLSSVFYLSIFDLTHA
jgi:hypothetical protein